MKLLIILGSTGTGKTDLGLFLAKRFNGEIISSDSRQVYKNLDIGTGKMPGKVKNVKKEEGRWVVDGVAINLYDMVDPRKQYNVSKFIKDANKVIKDIQKRKKLPILVGGTGLYMRALVEGLDSLSIPVNKILRKELEQLTLLELQDKLKNLSLEKWNSLNFSDRQNPRRLIRSLELISMYPYTSKKKIRGLSKDFSILKIGLSAPRNYLYQRADSAVLSRINQGMIDEVLSLVKKRLSNKRMKQLGLEYGVLALYLKGEIKTKEELIKILQGKIHGYIRRQLTYFKKEKDVNWFDITDKKYRDKLENSVKSWYYSR